jgi:hypothetical protein
MLASFESFFQSSKTLNSEGDIATFDQQDQTDDEIEKEGIDAASIGELARSYREVFHTAMPHPKMDRWPDHLRIECFEGKNPWFLYDESPLFPNYKPKSTNITIGG